MRRPIAIVLAVALVLPIGAGLLMSRIDADRARPRLAAALSAAIGRPVSIDGPMRLRWSAWPVPLPVLSASLVSIDNLPGGSRTRMATIERIEARIDPLALLRHRLDLTQLTLVGPNILFETAGGKPNWTFRSGPRSGAASRWSIRIGAVTIRNGMVTYRFPARSMVIGLRRLDYAQARPDGPLSLAGTLVYSDYTPFALNLDATPTGTVRDPWTVRLSLSAFESRLSAQGRIDLLGGYDLAAQIRVPALEALDALLPDLHLPRLHGIVLDTRLSSPSGRFDLPTLGASTLHLSGADLSALLPGLSLGEATATLSQPGGTLRAQAAVSLSGRRLALDGMLAVPVDPAATARLAARLHVSAGTSADAAFDGHLALRAHGFDGLDGTLRLRAAALAGWGRSLPALHGLALRARLAVPAQADRLSIADASLIAREAAGGFTLVLAAGDTPRLSAQLHLDRLDLDPLLPRANGGDRDGALFPAAPLDWRVLSGRNASLSATLGRLRWAGRDWPPIALQAGLSPGRVAIDRLTLAPPGGSGLVASAHVDATRHPAVLALDADGPAIPLSLLLGLAGVSGTATGTLALHASLTATGDSLHALAATVSGPVSLTLEHGTLSDPAFAALAGPALTPLHLAVAAQGETPLRCLGVVGRFAQGVGRFPVIAMETGILDLDGHGEIDLGAETLAMKLHPLARLAGHRVAVPVLVSGSLAAPGARLDATGLDKIGLLVDALFGGDRARGCDAQATG